MNIKTPYKIEDMGASIDDNKSKLDYHGVLFTYMGTVIQLKKIKLILVLPAKELIEDKL